MGKRLAVCSALLALSACKASIPEGKIACTEDEHCPAGWFCHRSPQTGRCYSYPQDMSSDAGTTANVLDSGPLVIIDRVAKDAGAKDAGTPTGNSKVSKDGAGGTQASGGAGAGGKSLSQRGGSGGTSTAISGTGGRSGSSGNGGVSGAGSSGRSSSRAGALGAGVSGVSGAVGGPLQAASGGHPIVMGGTGALVRWAQ